MGDGCLACIIIKDNVHLKKTTQGVGGSIVSPLPLRDDLNQSFGAVTPSAGIALRKLDTLHLENIGNKAVISRHSNGLLNGWGFILNVLAC